MKRGDRALIAESHDVCTSTLRRWVRAAEEGAVLRRPGRPPRGEDERERARELVAAELEQQGSSAGEAPVHHALGGRVPLRLVREVLRELKRERRGRHARHRAEHRRSIHVEARDVLWSLDGTYLGHDPEGLAVMAEVLREVGSTRTIEIAVGPPATGADVVVLLERARRMRGALPLALATDNGSAYCSQVVARYLAESQVVHLKSLPRTPQHNAWSEHGMRELKEEADFERTVPSLVARTARLALLEARDRLDEHRPRRSRGWRTAVEHDAALVPAGLLVDRLGFYAAVCCAIQEAVLHSRSRREHRRATREAVLLCMQRFELITMTRGGATIQADETCKLS
jgi:transposase-like protein